MSVLIDCWYVKPLLALLNFLGVITSNSPKGKGNTAVGKEYGPRHTHQCQYLLYISNLYAGIWVVFCILFGFMCFVCQLIIIKRVALTYICLCTVDCTQRIYIYPYRTDRTPSPRHPKLRRLSPPPVGSYTDRQVVQYTSRQSKERRLNLRRRGVLSVLLFFELWVISLAFIRNKLNIYQLLNLF